ncbi:MAG TPA: HIT domain-containing protein [Bacteroidota bacterium]|nr:HIT domain-containing protein [Bacteroidota bacterium]
MKRLHSPWRSEYIQTFKTPGKKSGCVLCAALRSDRDDSHYVVARGRHSFVILNLYPYNSGHCMVVPNRHVPRLDSLTPAEYSEMFRFIRKVIAGLERVSAPDGFNIGSNFGRTAGAGIDDHIHFHVVPRWNGDTNFMPVLADTKVISEEMNLTWEKLRKALKRR